MSAQVLFLAAWKDGMRLAGPSYFGRTDQSIDPERAESKWDYCPLEPRIEAAFGVLSGGEKRFLAAMVSFYNSEWGQQLLERAGAPNICDVSAGLDTARRAVIARLFLSYEGW